MTLRAGNAQARRLFLAHHGLCAAPGGRLTGAELLALIRELGFVQLDSIRTVERAHHMILFTRRSGYRPAQLARLLERERSLFENWTHDAAIIPTAFFPVWQRRFAREAERLAQRWRRWHGDDFLGRLDAVLDRVATQGPVRAGHLSAADGRGNGGTDGGIGGGTVGGTVGGTAGGQGWWDWAPSKAALEYLWRTGRLAVTRREGFQKVYDLTERVIPPAHRDPAARPDDAGLVDWACRNALDRLGFATPGELARFWDGITPAEAAAWCAAQGEALRRVEIAEAGGGRPRAAYAWADQAARLAGPLDDLPAPPGRLRLLSPFDPLLRDRQRTERLFGFAFRIEVFVPAARRRYGYYVFPLLEGERLIGRLDMSADREADALVVRALWLEPGLRPTKARLACLEHELERHRRFAGCGRLVFRDRWLAQGT